MKTNLRLSFQRGDWIAIALVAILAAGTAAAFLLPASGSESALLQVYQDGSMIKELPLDADTDFEVHGEYTNYVSISGGRAAIVNSDCPGQDCMHSGWISNAGRSIVCLPNRVELRIVGLESEVDFTVG